MDLVVFFGVVIIPLKGRRLSFGSLNASRTCRANLRTCRCRNRSDHGLSHLLGWEPLPAARQVRFQSPAPPYRIIMLRDLKLS